MLPYSSDDDDEITIQVSEDELAAIFEDAKAAGETLDDPGETIDGAIDDPLSSWSYLIFVDGEIAFDPDYVRPKPDETQA